MTTIATATTTTSSSSSTNTSYGAHILVFPFPAHGHMLPLLDLSQQLSQRGLSITILVTTQNLPLLSSLLSTSPSITPLVLPFPSHSSPLPPGVENAKDLPPSGFVPLIHALGGLHDPLLLWFQSHHSPPLAIISDFFLGWTHHLATRLRIPRIVFCPSFAKTFTFLNRLWQTMPMPRPNPTGVADNDNNNNNDHFIVSFPDIPHSPKYPWRQLSTLYKTYKRGDPASEFLKDGMLTNLACWGVIFNSFDGFERVYIDHTKQQLGHQRVWALGPLLPPPADAIGRGGLGSVSSHDLMSWLDSKADGSVAYVCFGSQAMLTRAQMQALADGLDQSGANFLWVCRAPLPIAGQVVHDYDVVPAGFDERVAGRGLVVHGWAPQVAILNHRAVGGFLTHCGSNSLMEAVVAGVPILAWPMRADQYLNATLMVEELGLGARVCEGAETVPDPQKLAQAVVELVSRAPAERVRAQELSRKAMGAVQEGGSSFQALDDLVKRLNELRRGHLNY